MVNRAPIAQAMLIRINGLGIANGEVKVTTVGNEEANAENCLDNPGVVVPNGSQVVLHGSKFSHILPANSLTVMRVPVSE